VSNTLPYDPNVLRDLLMRALTRRWRLALVTVVTGLFVTLLLHPRWGVHEYEATHVLYSPAAARSQPGPVLTDPFMLKPEAIAALATSRQTAVQAAATLGYDGNPLNLVEHVRAVADTKAGSVSITDRRTDAASAAAVANAVAEALIKLVDEARGGARAKALDEARGRVDELSKQLNGLDATDTGTKPQRDQLAQQLAAKTAEVDQLQHTGTTSGISTIRAAAAHKVSSGALRSLPPLVGWLLTLLPLAALGAGVAVAAELADDTVADGEAARVLTELPLLAVVPKEGDDGAALTGTPAEAVARAVADLREAVLDTARPGAAERSFVVPAVHGQGRVVMFTSPLANQGTTDTVIRFAAAIAEAGRSALIVDCDQAEAAAPEADVESDDAGQRRGLGDLVAAGIVPQSLQAIVQPTSLPRVTLVPHGGGSGVTEWLVRHRDLVDRARGLADVVILHGPGVLNGGGAASLGGLADETVLVCRVGTTRTSDAVAAAERLRAGNVRAGVVAVDAVPPPAPVPTPAELVQRVRTDARLRGRVEWLGAAAAMLLLFVFLRAFVFESFSIPTPSMVPYLEPGDRVLVSRLSYRLHDVHRGDVIVFDAPKGATALQGERLIKRVIALPGETVESRDGHILVNGKQLPETYLPKSTVTEGVKKLTLPKGRYWVMGDNRSNSADSRFFGSITRGSIIGRAFFHIWPWPVGLM
jgi:signal peptidase I